MENLKEKIKKLLMKGAPVFMADAEKGEYNHFRINEYAEYIIDLFNPKETLAQVLERCERENKILRDLHNIKYVEE